jgi:beta-xylosidase
VSFGRPQGLTPVIDRLPAVITGYHGGPHQGLAIADALFGVTNPAGKLPVTLPRHVGQVPIHHAQHYGSGYRRTAADIHRGYLDMPSTPLFPFGHGLSYTTFDYGPLELESDIVDVNGEARVSVTVTNSGDFVMEPGPVELSAGSSSSDLRSGATFTVTGDTRVISGEERAFLSVATVG